MIFFLESYACPAPLDITAMLSPSFCYIHPLLEIPANIQPQIFPSSGLSVIELLEFLLPLISATTCKHAAASFFSSNAPTVDLPQDILKIVVPPEGCIFLQIQGDTYLCGLLLTGLKFWSFVRQSKGHGQWLKSF
jgi:hypothetical protein